MLEQLAAQMADDALGRPVGGAVGERVQQRTGDDGEADQGDGRGDLAKGRVVQERAVHRMGERDRLDHDGQGGQRAERESDGGDAPQAGQPGGQLGVDQAGPARAGGHGAQRLNVVSFTSTARPMRPSATARRAVAASSQVAAVRAPSGRSATMALRTGSAPSSPP